MKNKPTRHKERNTFKFQPFSERIANIDVDVFHRVRHKFEDAEEDETYLHQCLQKWNVLNLTDSYDNFRKELPNIQTLPLIINQKEAIVAVILKHLAARDPLSLQPILEFVVALARDLRQEIYPFYQDILQTLIPLLSTKDADQLEWTFNCLAYVFKFLWRYFVKDVNAVFDSLIPLLGSTKPPYINNFAAESFAFIARKVKDKSGFISLILSTLHKKPEAVPGCGHLLFEVVKGVSAQFHSCAENVLPLYFKALLDEQSQDLLFDILNHFMTALTSGIRPQKSATLWSTLFETLQLFLSSWSTDPSQLNEKALLYLLKLLYQLVKFKNSVFVLDSGSVVKQIISVIGKTNIPDSIISVVLDIGACLLLSSELRLSQEHASLLSLKILALPHPALLLEFTGKILSYSGFDTLVLPRLLQYCNSCVTRNEDCHRILYLLTQLVLYKAPLCSNGKDLENWHLYPLNFTQFERLKTRQSLAVSTFSDFVVDLLSFETIEELSSQFEECVCALICLPHLIPQKSDEELLNRLVQLLLEFLSHSSLNNVSVDVSEEEKNSASADNSMDHSTLDKSILNEEQLLFLIYIAVHAAIHTLTPEKLRNIKIKLIDDLLPYANKPRFLNALRIIDLYLTATKSHSKKVAADLSLLTKIHSRLEKNLSSPFHKMRLLTSHIFALFGNESDDMDINGKDIPSTVFQLCFTAESIPPTIHEYREKLQHLQNLEYEAVRAALSNCNQFNKVPLHYLLGVLYVNFQLLWEPTSKLISTYAQGMQLSEFWSVFGDQLRSAAVQIRAPDATENLTDNSSLLKNEFLRHSYVSLNEMNDKPDYVNYRILLWKTFSQFAEICEVKNKEVSPIFLTFVEDEFFKKNVQEAKSLNIKKGDNPTGETDTSPDVNKISEENEEDQNEIEAQLEKTYPMNKMTTKEFVRTLAAHMTVFSKLRNPKAIFREPELNTLYCELLMHKNNEIQKLALTCLLTYKYKFLLPYQNHLFNLLDDKAFKNELTVFRIDKESDLIQNEHRQQLMPIVMRIVYSRMLTKTGSKTTGKAAAQLRRSLVLRFLAGCHENELMVFVQMAFKNLTNNIKDDVEEMVSSITKSLDLEHAPNPKQLQSSVNLLGVILDKFGSLMGEQLLPYLLRVMICIGAIAKGLLEKRDMVFAAYIPALRNLRNSCTATLTRFFSRFDEYAWTPSEIDAVFDVFVWPCLERLPYEGIHSPTALLKLFMAWSHNSRYFMLFAKHLEGNPDVSPLPYMMKLLLGQKTHSSVRNAVMEIVENLLTLQDHQKEQEDNVHKSEECKIVIPLQVNCVLQIGEDVVSHLSLNYGSGLLLPHVPSILEHLRQKLSCSKSGLGNRDSEVLARVTELVHDPTTSDLLLQLLLPTVNKKASAAEETVCQLLTTVANLIKNLPSPSKYLRSLAPLFGAVVATSARKLLCNLVMAVAERSQFDQGNDMVMNAQLLFDINAWDSKWIEQPDFNRRLDGFKRAKELSAEGKILLDFGVGVIHNCFYVLRTEKDLSLKDSAGYCLRILTPALCQKYSENFKEREFLVSDTLLNILQKGIRDSNETVRHESLCLLGELARQCEEVHPVFRDLSKLTNKADPEVDFFENIVHLQSHRKARALLKFCDISNGLTEPPAPRTLTHFVLPCASLFLCSEKYANKNSLIDAAIQTVGVVARLLPWHQYETLLRFYLTKMRFSAEFQKQLVRIIVAILDSFHYNLDTAIISSVSDVSLSNAEKNVVNKNEIAVALKEETVKGNESGSVDMESLETQPSEEGAEKSAETITDEHLQTMLDSCEIEHAECFGSTESLELATQQEIKLSKSAASRVVSTITNSLLPLLHRIIGQHSATDNLHKLNRRQSGPDQDEDDVLRIPMALASVKLLQKLPRYILDQHLPGIFLRLCTFLKSRMDSVRRVTRDILQKIMLSLGPLYLRLLLSEMSSLLTKGFHVHVLTYTVHSVLVALKDFFQEGDVDNCLQYILELCKLDLFGAAAEEKSVSQITTRFFEAKSTKSIDMFHISSQFVSANCLTDLLLPLKEVLVQSHSHKTVTKVSDCLRQIAIGLSENNFLSAEDLLVFLYGITSQSIPDLVPQTKTEDTSESQKNKLPFQQPDSFLIPEAPRSRTGAINVKAKISAQANAHVLIEFGLRLFHILLKKERVKSQSYKPYLDPMVAILHDCLKSQHVKRSTQALQCLSWVLKMDLPSVRVYAKDISSSIFMVLHKYAVSGMSKGDNYDLVAAAFKAVTVLVRDVEHHVLKIDQLKALLLYAEKDMHDYQRQATAFGLLRAILARRIRLPEIVEVMQKVAALSITSEHSHIRMQARQVFHQYIMHYPLGKKLEHHLSFLFAQLNYRVQSGRESALEMLQALVTSFPQETLEEHSALFFISISVQLVNDESPDCRKMVAKCIKALIERLGKSGRNNLFDIVMVWLQEMKIKTRQLAAQLCGLFVQVEKEEFENRFRTVLPALLLQFGQGFEDNRPGRFVRITPAAVDTDSDIKKEQEEIMKDHLLFQVFQTLLKICEQCPAFLRTIDTKNNVETFAENAKLHLSHEHEWVRLGAAQFLGFIFGSVDPRKLALYICKTIGSDDEIQNYGGYGFLNSTKKLKSLVLDLCAQLQPVEISDDFVEQVIKDLVFLARVLKHLDENNISEEKEILVSEQQISDNEEDLKVNISLVWMILRMRRILNTEIIHAPQSTVLQKAVLKWIGAVAVDLGKEKLPMFIRHLLPPLVRELTRTDDLNSDLHHLAKEVSNIIKKKVGQEEYTRHFSKLQMSLSARRANRKKIRAQEVVTEPQKAAKRRIKKQLKRKDNKKKRISVLKGHIKQKKKRSVDHLSVDEIM